MGAHRATAVLPHSFQNCHFEERDEESAVSRPPGKCKALTVFEKTRPVVIHLFLALCFIAKATSADAQSPPAQAQPPIRYVVSLAHPEQHLVHVKIALPPGAPERDLQLPVWNALYQIRDFSQYVLWVRAYSAAGEPLTVRLQDKSRWRIEGAEHGALVQYQIFADDPGPYGAQLNPQHAFFNLAEILMYPVDARSSPVSVDFRDRPQGWHIAAALAADSADELRADDYDRLVDAPVEIGTFQERDFDQGGGHYRVVVDADPADYDLEKISSMLQRIVATETEWMNDRPFATYLFLYHFPRGPGGGGGMEHSNCTAIDVNARVLAENPMALPKVTAHEFFHLWNVKRIRPQSLEPIDYTKENYTTSLWFSEGFTNTVQNYALLRAGLLDEPHYLQELAGAVEELERRPAHLTQSAEESSLSAWLEKYSVYRLPERSISYYNKGEVLGVALDLAVRDASHGAASLRDIFQWMNQNYARQGRFFPDSDGIRQAAEAVSHADLRWFFQKYVAGTDELPWDDFFKTVGLHLVQHSHTAADLGFYATRNFDEPPRVAWIDSGSDAARAGLAVDDFVLAINGREATSDFLQRLAELRVGDTLRLRVRNASGEHELHWKLASREEVELALEDVDNVTPQQQARRTAWLNSEDQPAAGTHP